MGAYHSTKNFEISEMGTNGTEISSEKVPENTESLNFRKANHSIGSISAALSCLSAGCFPEQRLVIEPNHWTENSEMKVESNGNFQKIFFENLGIPHEVVLFFRNLCKFPIFYSALASSFGRDHSELDISCKDDAHSIKETL